MNKKKKVARFRELYDVTNVLLDSYTYDDVVEILDRDHDFKIQVNTLTHYVYKHRKMLKELGDVNGNHKPTSEPSSIPVEASKSSVEKNDSVEDTNSSSDEDYDDLDAAIERAKKKVSTKSHGKSILNRR